MSKIDLPNAPKRPPRVSEWEDVSSARKTLVVGLALVIFFAVIALWVFSNGAYFPKRFQAIKESEGLQTIKETYTEGVSEVSDALEQGKALRPDVLDEETTDGTLDALLEELTSEQKEELRVLLLKQEVRRRLEERAEAGDGTENVAATNEGEVVEDTATSDQSTE